MDCCLPQWQINELEEKLREQEKQFKWQEQEQQLPCTLVDSTNSIRSTPLESKHFSRDELMNDAEHYILKSSNSMKRQMSLGSTLPKGSNDDTRRKRLSRNSDTENIAAVNPHRGDNKGRQSDPPKPLSRVTRTTKPVPSSQRPITHNRPTARDHQTQGVKVTESKKRVWTR